MAFMVATCFITFQPSLHPRLTSLHPNTRSLNTPISSCFSSRLHEQGRVSFPLYADSKCVSSPFPMPRAFESFRSFMFGDGDPNQEAREERWKNIAQYITSRGGVVAAEELAPYLLDPFEDQDEERFMLPILTRFDGYPVIDEETGNVLYRFISMLPTSEELKDPNFVENQRKVKEKMFVEREWGFSKSIRYGCENAMLIASYIFTSWQLVEYLLVEAPISPVYYVKSLSAMLMVLTACGMSLVAIPSLRFALFCVVYLKRNADIKKRNLARERCAKDVESPDLELRRKLKCARDMAKRSTLLTDVMNGKQEDVLVNV